MNLMDDVKINGSASKEDSTVGDKTDEVLPDTGDNTKQKADTKVLLETDDNVAESLIADENGKGKCSFQVFRLNWI